MHFPLRPLFTPPVPSPARRRRPPQPPALAAPGARHIRLGDPRDGLAEVAKDRTVLAVCRSGSRSEAATRGLRTLGYTVENLEGGVTAWKRAGLPLEAEGGGPGRVI